MLLQTQNWYVHVNISNAPMITGSCRFEIICFITETKLVTYGQLWKDQIRHTYSVYPSSYNSFWRHFNNVGSRNWIFIFYSSDMNQYHTTTLKERWESGVCSTLCINGVPRRNTTRHQIIKEIHKLFYAKHLLINSIWNSYILNISNVLRTENR